MLGNYFKSILERSSSRGDLLGEISVGKVRGEDMQEVDTVLLELCCSASTSCCSKSIIFSRENVQTQNQSGFEPNGYYLKVWV